MIKKINNILFFLFVFDELKVDILFFFLLGVIKVVFFMEILRIGDCLIFTMEKYNFFLIMSNKVL